MEQIEKQEKVLTHFEIVTAIVGAIEPVGASHTDAPRFENLKDMCKLVGELTNQIAYIARFNKRRPEHSMQKAGDYADKFLAELVENIENPTHEHTAE